MVLKTSHIARFSTIDSVHGQAAAVGVNNIMLFQQQSFSLFSSLIICGRFNRERNGLSQRLEIPYVYLKNERQMSDERTQRTERKRKQSTHQNTDLQYIDRIKCLNVIA